MISAFDMVENAKRKVENADNQHFLFTHIVVKSFQRVFR